MNKGRVRFISIFAVLMLVAVGLPSAPSTGYAQGTLSRTFPQTGKTVTGRFLQYWDTNGGLEQQGYPVSEVLQERSEVNNRVYFVQYFERAVFEFHPENPFPSDVLLSLLGVFRYQQKYPGGAPGQQPDTSPGSIAFQQTGKRLGGRFLQYWRTHGGLPQQGYPISDPFVEVSELNGQPYLVQYFERAVFELHPENRPPHDVLLSQLGTFRLQATYPTGLDFADGDGDGVSNVDDRCPDSKENLNKIFDTDGCPDTLDDLIREAEEHINGFWQEVFDNGGVEYFPPTEIVPYTRPIQTACGAATLNTAFYCRRSHGIYLDYNFLAEQLYTDGDFAPVTILAHEWGHLIQANLGILQSDAFFTIEIELQADCLAGAWAFRAAQDKRLEEGDLDEAAVSLFKAGDDINTPWFDPRAHGQPEQRIQAFNTGFESGIAACEIVR